MVFHERNTSGVNEKGFVFLGPGCVSVYARACDSKGLQLRMCARVCACVCACRRACVRVRTLQGIIHVTPLIYVCTSC